MAKIYPISDLRRRTAEVIGAVQTESGVVYITQYGRPSVVLVDYEYYETLMSQLEDLSDMVSLQVAADEPDPGVRRCRADLHRHAALEIRGGPSVGDRAPQRALDAARVRDVRCRNRAGLQHGA